MKPRRPDVHKTRNDYARRRHQRFLSERSALLLTMALVVGAGAAGLLYAAHQSIPMVVFSAVGVFAGALRLLSDLID